MITNVWRPKKVEPRECDTDTLSREGGDDAPPRAAPPPPSLPQEVHSYVGFANFPNQIYRRALKNGFEFTLMVVGQSGLGKTTFFNSLFLTELCEPTAYRESMEPTAATTRIQERTVKLSENGVNLLLTLIDCPGFGDAVDNSKCFEPIVQHIENKFFEYFREETKIERTATIPDRRVHLCLYFISPSGHGLKQLDVMIMKYLHDRVNLLPVIAKADTMTTAELSNFKKKVMEDIAENGIKMYSFPELEDEEERRKFGPLRERVPFAVIGSNEIRRDADGRIRRCRDYPWGTVEVENLDHNDFLALRDLIIRLNLIDLIDVTRNVHYENFRLRQLNSEQQSTTDCDPFTKLEIERRQKDEEFVNRASALERTFAEKVKEREKRLEAQESELASKEENNRRFLEEKRAALERLMAEVVLLRRGHGHHQSSSDVSLHDFSIKENVKKGLGLFHRKD